MTALLVIGSNIILMVAALGFGSLLLSLVPKTFTFLDRVAVAVLGGVGSLGTLLFCIGQVWFTRAAIRIILGAGVFLALRFLVARRPSAGSASSASLRSFLPVLTVSVVLFITAVGGLAEPTGDIKMDEIAYHLLGPKVWLRNGVIRPVTDEAYTAFPSIAEVQYGALMSLGGQRAPGLFSFTSLICLLVVAAALSARLGVGWSACWWTLALVITMPVVYRGAYGGFVDVIFSSFVLGALRVALDAERLPQFILFAIFGGFAAGTKYTGLIALTLLFLCVFLFSRLGTFVERRPPLKLFGAAGAAAFVVAAPWYLRNWLFLGCPIYPPPPLLWRLFPAKYLSVEAIQHFHAAIRTAGLGMGRGPLSLILLPFHLTFHPANFLNGAGGIGLAPLALAPFGIFSRRQDWRALFLAFFALLQTLVWFVTEQEARFLIHVYVIAAIFAMLGWTYVVNAAPKRGPLLSAIVIGCSIVYGLFMIGSARGNDLRAAVSPSFEARRRQLDIPFLESFNYLNKRSSVRRVLVLQSRVPTYYLDKDYLKPIGRWGEDSLPGSRNLDLLVSELPSLHITHVLDVQEEGRPFLLPSHPANLTLVFEKPDQRIYEVH